MKTEKNARKNKSVANRRPSASAGAGTTVTAIGGASSVNPLLPQGSPANPPPTPPPKARSTNNRKVAPPPTTNTHATSNSSDNPPPGGASGSGRSHHKDLVPTLGGGKQDSTRRRGNIESQPWYHGFRTRTDVVQVLKQPGDWLVRATEGRNKTELVISLLNEQKNVTNLTIKYDEVSNKWELGLLAATKRVKHFDTVLGLVNYYRSKGLPGNLTMRRAVYREKWLVRHELINFDPAKDLLGRGNFCDVYHAKFEQTPSNFVDVAVKVCHKDDDEVPQDATEAREAMVGLVREGRIMSYYSHENVIQFYGVACDHKPIMIVMEFCSGGSLDIHLRKEGDNIELGERVLFCYEAAKGMNYLHRQGCVHRDLAARNCLISHKGTIKIADFGLSDMVNVADRAAGQVNKQQVPLRWMAPESLVKQPVYSRKTDVWSFAVLMYEIFNNGQKPWPDEEPKKIATMIRKCQMPDMPKITPTEIKGLANSIWIKDMDSRPEFKKILIELFEVHHIIHRPPEPKKCSTNRLPGVTRCPFDERLEDVRYRVIDLNQPTEDTRTKEGNLNEESDPLTVGLVGNVNVVPNPTIRGAMLIDEPSTMTGIPLKPDEEVAMPAVKGQPIKYVAGKKKMAPAVVAVTPGGGGGGGSSRKRNLPAKT
uniref:Tyrosine-protein kinase n=1 Tax=Panagrellus redivivus TaxID=6233 RepID=A0A7E4ZUA7_PANRE